MTDYRHAASVERIATGLIASHHQHLTGIRIEYVFREKHAKKGGREVWGTARKVSGLNAYLATRGDETPVDVDVEDLFVIEIAEDIWARLSDPQRRALVDHELCHCVTELDDEGALVLKTTGHDLEEFSSVVERHGLWRSDVKQFAAVAWEAQQLPLGGDGEAA